MSVAAERDVGSLIKGLYGANATSVTAGGAGDNTEIDGEWGSRADNLSCSLFIPWEATLGATETLTISANIQDAADISGTGAADYSRTSTGENDAVLASVVVADAALLGGAGTYRGVAQLDVDLSGAREFIRSQVTPDLSAANTDTAEIGSVFVLGGSDQKPNV